MSCKNSVHMSLMFRKDKLRIMGTSRCYSLGNIRRQKILQFVSMTTYYWFCFSKKDFRFRTFVETHNDLFFKNRKTGKKTLFSRNILENKIEHILEAIWTLAELLILCDPKLVYNGISLKLPYYLLWSIAVINFYPVCDVFVSFLESLRFCELSKKTNKFFLLSMSFMLKRYMNLYTNEHANIGSCFNQVWFAQ